MSIELESFARVADLSTQRNSDQHLRNMRCQVEQTLRDEVIARWRLDRRLPRWLPEDQQRRARRLSVTAAESLLVRACYREACRQVQDGINRDRTIDRARPMAETHTREVGGWLPTG